MHIPKTVDTVAPLRLKKWNEKIQRFYYEYEVISRYHGKVPTVGMMVRYGTLGTGIILIFN